MSTAVIQGYCFKLGEKNKKWKKRFLLCDVRGRQLGYYEDNPMNALSGGPKPKQKGSFDLRRAVLRDIDHATLESEAAPSTFGLILVYRGKERQFCFDNWTEKEQWKKVLDESIETRDMTAEIVEDEAVKGMSKKEGFLRKCNSSGKHWADRWCVLEPLHRSITYYEDEAKTIVKGEVDLRGASIRIARVERGFLRKNLTVFEVRQEDRVFKFHNKKDKDLRSWYHAVKAVCDLKTRKLAAYLYKTNPQASGWQERWMVLDPLRRNLSYFESNDKGQKPKNVIKLTQCKIRIVPVSEKATLLDLPTEFIFSIQELDSLKSRLYAAKSAEVMKEWVAMLEECATVELTHVASFRSTKESSIAEEDEEEEEEEEEEKM
eukprot:TRINITY_DN616_c0_g1_i2.p1 TRINITY_DN616_c0_g1~~TRINITY_DN616_c0_g1_i2.p1  ORF type:complete len:376 (+),score=113.49 TRINITY_DN616_c0_g1_i2:50-1177(+)